MAFSRKVPLPEPTYRSLYACKEEITDLCLRKFSCEVELRGPELSDHSASVSSSVAASVKPDIVYEKKLWGGPLVSVWKDDLTRQDTDVVVNAANEGLKHIGGLARALAEAGGPIVEKDSKEYIRVHGDLKTGAYAVTRPGNLPCKCLLHAVGPFWMTDIADRCDRELEECIRNVFKYLNQHKDIKSVAIPAVSSGIFQFPLPQCADIIVKTVHSCSYNVKHLKEIRLVNNNDPAVQAMKSACENIFGPSDDLSGATSASSNQTRPTTRSMTANPQPSLTATRSNAAHQQPSASRPPSEMPQPITLNGLTLHLKKGFIQEQNTTVIVNSLGKDLIMDAGQVSKAILSKAGYGIQKELNATGFSNRQFATMIPTMGYNLPCSRVYHVIIVAGYQRNNLDVLVPAITECLATLHNYHSSNSLPSISFPALGTGNIGLSGKVVAYTMMDAVVKFASTYQGVMNVYFVIHPQDTWTYQAFQDQWTIYERNKSASMQKEARPDIHNKSSEYQEEETPCLVINATSNEDAEEVIAWLNNINQPQPISIQNNFVLLLGQEEHEALSSLDFPDISIVENLSNGMSCLKIHGLPQDQKSKIKAFIEAELLLLDVQEKHAVMLEEELLEAAVIWFYENETGTQKYPAKANRELEKAFVTQTDIKLKSEPYHKISIKDLTADGKNGKFRLQRRPIRDSSKGVQKGRRPDDWLSQVTLVDPNSQEFSDYTKKLKKERLTLIKMERIQNRYLSEIFQSKKEEKTPNKKTCHAFQVVPRQFTRLICDVGFQRIFCNPRDTKYGQGIYFTDSPRRALECFQTPKEKSGPIYIFQAEVLIDSPTDGRKDTAILTPKKLISKTKDVDILDLCDNSVNSTTPSIYVIPDSFQANPMYLFTCTQSG